MLLTAIVCLFLATWSSPTVAAVFARQECKLLLHGLALILAIMETSARFSSDTMFGCTTILLPVVVFLIFNFRLERRFHMLTTKLQSKEKELQEWIQMQNNVLSLLSHELRTPINQVLASCDLLENTKLNAEQLSLTILIKEGGTMLLENYNAILDLLNVKTKMKLERCSHSLRECIDDVVKTASPKIAAKSMKFLLEYDSRLPEYVMGDPRRLRQMLNHLLDNAIKFSPPIHGEISFRIHQLRPDVVEFDIIDNGIGMSEEELKNIYVPFWQADMSLSRQYGGVGLGLPFTEQVIRLFEGEITFKSTGSSGIHVKIILPLPPSQACNGASQAHTTHVLDAPPAQSPDVHERSARKVDSPDLKALNHARALRTLVVEDNMLNMRVMCRMLESVGVSPDKAVDGSKAIAAVSAQDYHIIFMDVHMPVCDGITAT